MSEEQRLRSAVQILAASNARLCAIAEAADKLEKAVRDWLDGDGNDCAGVLYGAVDAYKIVRVGQ